MIFIFKGIPASASPFKSVNSHKTKSIQFGCFFVLWEYPPYYIYIPSPISLPLEKGEAWDTFYTLYLIIVFSPCYLAEISPLS